MQRQTHHDSVMVGDTVYVVFDRKDGITVTKRGRVGKIVELIPGSYAYQTAEGAMLFMTSRNESFKGKIYIVASSPVNPEPLFTIE